MWNIDFMALAPATKAKLSESYAKHVAQVLQLPETGVVDRFGAPSSSSLSDSSTVDAFLNVPAGSSVNALGKLLYTESFQSKIMASTEEALKLQGLSMGRFAVRSVSIKPEEFVPLVPTTTATTVTTTKAPVPTTTRAPATVAPVTTTAAPEASRPRPTRPPPETYHKDDRAFDLEQYASGSCRSLPAALVLVASALALR